MTDERSHLEPDKTMRGIAAILRLRPPDGPVLQLVKQQYRWPLFIARLVPATLLVAVAGSSTRSYLRQEPDRTLRTDQIAAVSLQPLPELPNRVESVALMAPAIVRSATPFAHVNVRPMQDLPIASQKRLKRPSFQLHETTAHKYEHVNRYIANPLYGKQLRKALIQDRIQTRELNIQQLSAY